MSAPKAICVRLTIAKKNRTSQSPKKRKNQKKKFAFNINLLLVLSAQFLETKISCVKNMKKIRMIYLAYDVSHRGFFKYNSYLIL